jgi:hypothetical protein
LLAYLFWHRPRPGVDAAEYEEAQRGFHASLEVESACFRLDRLPFDDGPGYEDWYLVEDWAALGALNAAAVDSVHRPGHDRAAAMVAEGWGGVCASVQGPAAIPAQAQWRHKPPGQPAADFLAGIGAGASVWQRQMVLGPALEFCVATEEAAPAPYRRVRL